MKIELAIQQRNDLIEKLKLLLPADKFNEIEESVKHVCDVSFEAGKTFHAERQKYFDKVSANIAPIVTSKKSARSTLNARW